MGAVGAMWNLVWGRAIKEKRTVGEVAREVAPPEPKPVPTPIRERPVKPDPIGCGARWWECSDSPDGRLVGTRVEARTKGEARAALKLHHQVRQLPPGTVLRRV